MVRGVKNIFWGATFALYFMPHARAEEIHADDMWQPTAGQHSGIAAYSYYRVSSKLIQLAPNRSEATGQTTFLDPTFEYQYGLTDQISLGISGVFRTQVDIGSSWIWYAARLRTYLPGDSNWYFALSYFVTPDIGRARRHYPGGNAIEPTIGYFSRGSIRAGVRLTYHIRFPTKFISVIDESILNSSGGNILYVSPVLEAQVGRHSFGISLTYERTAEITRDDIVVNQVLTDAVIHRLIARFYARIPLGSHLEIVPSFNTAARLSRGFQNFVISGVHVAFETEQAAWGGEIKLRARL